MAEERQAEWRASRVHRQASTEDSVAAAGAAASAAGEELCRWCNRWPDGCMEGRLGQQGRVDKQ